MAVNTPGVDVIQFPFNLLDNRFQRGNIMTLAKEKGKLLQARSAFLQGLFFMPLADIPVKLSPLESYLKRIHNLANEYNISIERLALMYAFCQPDIDHVIIGVDNLQQLQRNLNALQQNISAEIIEKINQVSVLETDLLYPKTWN